MVGWGNYSAGFWGLGLRSELQELQCFLMVHIAQNECKSKFLMCILQNELRWVIIAHMFYLFKGPLWENNKDTLPRLPSVSLRAQDADPPSREGYVGLPLVEDP